MENEMTPDTRGTSNFTIQTLKDCEAGNTEDAQGHKSSV